MYVFLRNPEWFSVIEPNTKTLEKARANTLESLFNTQMGIQMLINIKSFLGLGIRQITPCVIAEKAEHFKLSDYISRKFTVGPLET